MAKCKRMGHDLPGRGRCPECGIIDAPQRFWTYVEEVDGHQLWTGSIHENGYGMFHIARRRYVRAHKYAWELRFGPVPDGLELGHTCEYRHCILHTRPVTHLRNVQEGNRPREDRRIPVVIDPDD